MTDSFRLRYSALSDVGRVRKDNQDSGYAGDHLLVVADGVAGAAYGDVASTTAVHVMRTLDSPQTVDDTTTEELEDVLADTVLRVHEKLAELVEHDSELSGTSTTLIAALFDGNHLVLAHVGDSRAYLLRRGELRQLTVDHTFVQTLIDEGRITAEEARHHPHRNLILRAVDGVNDAQSDLITVDLEEGDRILLCSDGCSGPLDAALIAALLGAGSVDFAAVELVRSALDHGSTDNVTVVVAEVADKQHDQDPETTASTVIGPLLVGAAAQQPRRAGLATRIGFFRRFGSDAETDDAPNATPPDLELLRYAPRPPRRLIWLRRLVWSVVAAGIVTLAATAGYQWTQGQYYVAPEGSVVAIHRGVDLQILGIPLHSVAETTPIQLTDLPPYNQELVAEGINASDLDKAEQIVSDLKDLACQQAREAAPAKPDSTGGSTALLPPYCEGTLP